MPGNFPRRCPVGRQSLFAHFPLPDPDDLEAATLLKRALVSTQDV
jgi:hypothetical protein